MSGGSKTRGLRVLNNVAITKVVDKGHMNSMSGDPGTPCGELGQLPDGFEAIDCFTPLLDRFVI